MQFTKFLCSILLATAASSSPLDSRNVTQSLGKREVSDGQAGAYIVAGENVAFAFVYGSPQMPDLTNAASGTQVSFWIGIDGTNTDRVIQAGFDAVKESDGTVTYKAFYEWYPNVAVFPDTGVFTASAGDIVSITVTVTGFGTSAAAAFVNKNTLETYNTPMFFSPGEEFDATGENAQWVIERAPGTTLAAFGKVIFTDCSVADSGGFQYFLTGGTVLELKDTSAGTTIANGAIVGNNEVDVFYALGPS